MMLYALLAAPAGWGLEELIGWAIASRHCGLRSAQLAGDLTRGMMPSFFILTVVAFALALTGSAVAWRAWQRTRGEKRDSGHHAAELGEGRTRFMALWALITSVSFSITLLFHAIPLWVAPLCGK